MKLMFYYIYTLYCILTYTLMSYYSFYILCYTDISFSHKVIIEHSYYNYLIICSISYLLIDLIYKAIDKRYLHYFCTNTSTDSILNIHHILVLMGTFYSYICNVTAISIVTLYLFEFSSIFLTLYYTCYEGILKKICMYLFWFSFLIVRIIFGNVMLPYLLYYAYYELDKITFIVSCTVYVFLFIVNNYWFVLLTKKIFKNSI
jgi:hypothetical protein